MYMDSFLHYPQFLFHSFIIGETIEGDIYLYFFRTLECFSLIVAPCAFGKINGTMSAFGNHGGYHIFVTEHELIFAFGESAMWKTVFHVAQDRLSGLGGMTGTFINVVAHRVM